MAGVVCPKCGMEAISGSSFWGSFKPYCSFCGWNRQAAKELALASLKGAPKTLLFFAAFFGFFGYLYKSEVVVFPFLFLSVFVTSLLLLPAANAQTQASCTFAYSPPGMAMPGRSDRNRNYLTSGPKAAALCAG